MNNPLLYPIIGQKKARYDIVLAPLRRPGEAPPADEPFKIYDGYGSLTSDMVGGKTWALLKNYNEVDALPSLSSDMVEGKIWPVLKIKNNVEGLPSLSSDMIDGSLQRIYKDFQKVDALPSLSSDMIEGSLVQVYSEVNADFNDWHVAHLTADMAEGQLYKYLQGE